MRMGVGKKLVRLLLLFISFYLTTADPGGKVVSFV